MRYIYVIEKEDLPKLLKGEDLKLDSSSNGATAFNIEINGELTNGDIIKAFFTDVKRIGESKDTIDISLGGFIHRYLKSWWNAPYKEKQSTKAEIKLESRDDE